MTESKRQPYRPWRPVQVRTDNETPLSRLTDLEINRADCAALQAVHKGVANAEQQQRAFAAVLHICGWSDLEFLPDEHGGERESAFKSGKRHIGLQLLKLVSHSLSILTGDTDGHQHRPDRRTGKPGDDRNSARARRQG